MDEKEIKIKPTGNQFVDTGIGVIGALAKRENITELTLTDLKSVYGDGSQLTGWNTKLKAFTQVFGTNNPLFQAGYGYKKGIGPSSTNKAIYKATLGGLLSEIGKSSNGPRCWACGTPSDFSFAEVCKKALDDNGKQAPEDKWVGRDWFPLAGSLGSDAQALPAASKPPHICPKCLFAIHYLPMGLILLEGRLVVFQCTSIEFWYELVFDIVNQVEGRVQAENYETIGSKEGSRAVMRRLLLWFERLQKGKHYEMIPSGTALHIWRFSNSGATPECSIEEVPNRALIFLWDVVQNGLRSDIEGLIGTEGKNPQYSLFRCILDRRDYQGLYPEGTRKGASSKLFAYYQTHIRGHSVKALQAAYKIANEAANHLDEKELKRLQRPEAFKETKIRNQCRAYMVQMAARGEFTVDDYIDLFPIKEGRGISVEWDGWNLIRFYLYHANEDFPKIEERDQSEIKPRQQLFYCAGHIYNHYLSERGKERFQREVLTQIDRKIGVTWLKNRFVQLAELKDGFTYGHWVELCKLEDGSPFVSELLFQMRLLWAYWIYEGRVLIDIAPPVDEVSTDGLPGRIKVMIEAIFADYVDRRGLGRFHRDILLRLRRGELGLPWFQRKLTKQTLDHVEPLTEEEWERFLVDDEGQGVRAERLFQLHLTLANFYRLKGQ